LQILVCAIQHFQAKQNAQKATVEELTDIKDFKKILRTKNNVLVCYISSQKQASYIVKIFKEAAEVVKGQGTMLLVDCSGWVKVCPEDSECNEANPEPVVLGKACCEDVLWAKVYPKAGVCLIRIQKIFCKLKFTPKIKWVNP